MASETIVVNGYYVDSEFYRIVCEDARKKVIAENQKRKRKRAGSRRIMERRRYFAQQKIAGMIMVACILIIALIDRNLLWLIFAIPAICMIKTKKMVLVTRYYWKQKRKGR